LFSSPGIDAPLRVVRSGWLSSARPSCSSKPRDLSLRR